MKLEVTLRWTYKHSRRGPREQTKTLGFYEWFASHLSFVPKEKIFKVNNVKAFSQIPLKEFKKINITENALSHLENDSDLVAFHLGNQNFMRKFLHKSDKIDVWLYILPVHTPYM